jgi:two-component system, cell cycle response regulator CpdR
MPHDPKVIPIMRGRLVLVADPYGTPRVLVTGAVQSLGYPAKAFATGTDVLAFLTLHPRGAQCLLADLRLPDMDGGELAERALDLVPSLRVVLMAAPDDPAAQHLLAGDRDLPCLTKPVHREHLAETLGPLLGSPTREPGAPPPMGQPRSRRRPSGSHPA